MKISRLLAATIFASALLSTSPTWADSLNAAPAASAATTTSTTASNPTDQAAAAPNNTTTAPAATATATEASPVSASTATAGSSSASSEFSPEQVKKIQTIVHDYLVNNPQVLVEASQALQKQNQEQEQKFAAQAIKDNVAALFNNPASPSTPADANTAVTIVEFFDYQCGHCKEMNSILQAVMKNNKNVRFIFKELPIFGEDSQFAAKAALAAAKQGKYVAFHDALLAAENPLTKDKVLKVAQKVGLNLLRLKKEMNTPAIQQQLRDNFKLAQTLRLVGTPTFVIGNKTLTDFRFIPGATTQDNLQSVITELSK